jgi:hypothetical protein
MDRFFRFVWAGSGAPLAVLNTPAEVDAQKRKALETQMLVAQSSAVNRGEQS